jgi:hypothetical protein
LVALELRLKPEEEKDFDEINSRPGFISPSKSASGTNHDNWVSTFAATHSHVDVHLELCGHQSGDRFPLLLDIGC